MRWASQCVEKPPEPDSKVLELIGAASAADPIANATAERMRGQTPWILQATLSNAGSAAATF